VNFTLPPSIQSPLPTSYPCRFLDLQVAGSNHTFVLNYLYFTCSMFIVIIEYLFAVLGYGFCKQICIIIHLPTWCFTMLGLEVLLARQQGQSAHRAAGATWYPQVECVWYKSLCLHWYFQQLFHFVACCYINVLNNISNVDKCYFNSSIYPNTTSRWADYFNLVM